MRNFFAAALALTASSVLAQEGMSWDEREEVFAFDDVVGRYGYFYEKYEVQTEDEWTLTLFRIKGRNAPTKPNPVFFMHDLMMDAASWLNSYEDDVPMPMQLVDQGYDVWMGNNRGTRFSLENPLYPYGDNVYSIYAYLTENALKYDYDWMTMGELDLPPMLDKVRAATNNAKLTYVGIGQGTSQLLYALTQKEEEYYDEILNKALLISPCVYMQTEDLDWYNEVYPKYRQQFINVFNDPNWQYDLDSLCQTPGFEAACQEGQKYRGQQESTRSMELFHQIAISGRFQKWSPSFSTDPLSGEVVTPGLESIDKVLI